MKNTHKKNNYLIILGIVVIVVIVLGVFGLINFNKPNLVGQVIGKSPDGSVNSALEIEKSNEPSYGLDLVLDQTVNRLKNLYLVVAGKKIVVESYNKACKAGFKDLKFNLGGKFLNDNRISVEACERLSSLVEKQILDDVCANSDKLENIEITWGSEVIKRVPLECDVEQDIPTFTGELEIVHIDFENGLTKNFYRLHDVAQNTVFNLVFTDEQPTVELFAESTIKVRGKPLSFRKNAAGQNEADLLLADSGEETVNVLEENSSTNPPQDSRKAIAILGNFNNANVACSQPQVEGVMFSNTNSVNNVYIETSFNKEGFEGKTVGPFNINYTASGCNYYAWAYALEAAAEQAGEDLSQYKHKVYVLPRACGWGGIANLGSPATSSPLRSWVFACNKIEIYYHELGHNRGMHHASTTGSEYGDLSDFMGGFGGTRQVNAPHKDNMFWFPSGKVLEVSQSGTFDIAPTEVDPSSTNLPQALKIFKADENTYYYLGYRRPIGFDSNLGSAYVDKVNIHKYRGSGATQTFFLSSLTDGQTYNDNANGLKFTQLSHDADKATIRIETVCSQNQPTLIINPAIDYGKPVSSFEYTVTIKNNDGSYCGNSQFSIGSSTPSGWSKILSQTSLTLSPGQTGTTDLTLTPPSTAADGSYSFKIITSDSLSSTHSSSKSGTAVIDTVPPTPPQNLLAEKKGRNNIVITWSASSDNNVVSHYLIYKNQILIVQTSSTSYTDKVSGKDLVEYYVVAVDVAGNPSGPSNIVSVGGGGGSTKGKVKPQCNDHIDNDGDGFCDFSWRKVYCDDGSIPGDSQCSNKNDNDES